MAKIGLVRIGYCVVFLIDGCLRKKNVTLSLKVYFKANCIVYFAHLIGWCYSEIQSKLLISNVCLLRQLVVNTCNSQYSDVICLFCIGLLRIRYINQGWVYDSHKPVYDMTVS